MNSPKSVAALLLTCVATLLVCAAIHAQNQASGPHSMEAPVIDLPGDPPLSPSLPKDVYPDSRNRLPLPNVEYRYTARLPTGIEQPNVSEWDLDFVKARRGANLKYSIGVSDRLLEVAVLAAARELDVQYEWTQWEYFGRNPADPRHIEQSTIDLIKYEKPVVGLGEKETAIINFARETFGQRRLSSATFAQVLHLFGREGTVELFWVMASYSEAAAELTAFDNHLRADQKPLLPPRPHSFDAERKASLAASFAEAAGPLPKDIYPDSGNRLPLPKREDMNEEGKKAFDQVNQPQRWPMSEAMTTRSVRLYADPRFAAGTDAKQRYLTYDTGLSARLVEISVLVAARAMDSQYEWTEWETYGRDPQDPRHIEPAIIDIIKYEKPVAGLGEKETAIINLGREMFGPRKQSFDNVSSATFAEVLRLFDRKGTVDVVHLMAQYAADAAELTAFDQHLKPGQKPLLPPR
jgi:4-carboxymuconolactone decarboxylase